jgi:hypothetical protein
MSIRNAVLDEVIAKLGRSNPPCECIYELDGYVHSQCNCGNYDDAASIAGWCADENTIRTIEKMKE